MGRFYLLYYSAKFAIPVMKSMKKAKRKEE